MKKLMISAIILLPLIILAIILVSGALLSIITHIYVEQVEFVERGEVVLEMPDEDAPPSHKLEVNVLPLKAANRDLIFTVEDDSIAEVDENGVLTAKYYGTTKVIVRSKENAAKTDVITVIVTDDVVHEVKIRSFDTQMYSGESLDLAADYYPATASNHFLEWSSSDDSVVSVTQSGKITCKNKKGSAIITCSYKGNPEVKDEVEVFGNIPLTSISVNAASQTVTDRNKTCRFPEIVSSPANATYTVTYKSSNEEVAAVDGEGNITFKKAGRAEITATATDGRGNSDSAKVVYNFTDGYFTGALFAQNKYEFDYDLLKGSELPDLKIAITESEYQRIVKVTCAPENLVTYNEGDNKFYLNDVGDETPIVPVEIKVRSIKYKAEEAQLIEVEEDKCTVNITRKAASLEFYKGENPISAISTASDNLTISKIFGSAGYCIKSLPANNNDTLTYSIDGDGAYIQDENIVKFTQDGTVTLNVTAAGGARASIEISYVKPQTGDTPISLPPYEEWGSDQSSTITLDVISETEKDNGVLTFDTPDGMTASVVSLNDDIVEVDQTNGYRLVPKKGGFADITVAFTSAANGARNRAALIDDGSYTYTIKVYVDYNITSEDIQFTGVPEGGTTSKSSIAYGIDILLPEGAMEGKKLTIGGQKMEVAWVPAYSRYKVKPTKFSYTVSLPLTDKVPTTVTADLFYDDEDARMSEYAPDKKGNICANSFTVTSSGGDFFTIDVDVTRDGQSLNAEDNILSFANAGETITLNVKYGNITPSDRKFDKKDVSFIIGELNSAACKVIIEIDDGSGSATIKLVAMEQVSDNFVLTVAGKTYKGRIEIKTPADNIVAKCNNQELSDGGEYTTLLSDLQITVTPGRNDGSPIDETQIHYGFGAIDGDVPLEGGSSIFDLNDITGNTELTITCGNVTIKFNIQKIDIQSLKDDLTYRALCNLGEEGVRDYGEFELGGGTVSLTFPQAMTGSFSVEISLHDDDNRIGGFDKAENYIEFFTMTAPETKWSAPELSTSGGVATYTATIDSEENYYPAGDEFTFTVDGQSVILKVSRSEVMSVKFEGFDSTNKTDVYKGYQQVRVFAKHSYYNGAEVDYFPVTYKALESYVDKGTPVDPAALTLNFYRHTDKVGGDGEETLISTQSGTTVTYGGVQYNIVQVAGGDSKLMQGDTVIAENGKFTASATVKFPWADVFAEDNIARVYFGDFAGLSESDVQNDYFGNFGEESDWSAKPEVIGDGSGRTFQPSANAYTFLKMEVEDVAKGNARNTHYNFNILDEDALVNVFNAEGYYSSANVVLHTDLYGAGELGTSGDKYKEATEKGLFLTKTTASDSVRDTSVLGKTLIYGNGYQVNLQAKNEQIKADIGNATKHSNGFNESYGVTFNRAYNVVIKGANPSDSINGKSQTIVLHMSYAYYCDLSYYYKFNPNGNAFYTKNTVFSSVPKTAIQLYYSETLYAENIVIVECGTGIQLDNKDNHNSKIYLKGNIDILDYANRTTLSNMNTLIGAVYDMVIPNVKDYVEWHCKNLTASTSSNDIDKFYVNVLLFTCADISGNVSVWQNNAYVPFKGSKLQNGSEIANKELLEFMGQAYYAWTYEILDSDGNRSDNANVSVSGSTAKAAADISKLFTDSRYIRLQCEFKDVGVKNYDHILWHKQRAYRNPELQGLTEDHITNLKKSLEGTKWVDANGNVTGVNGQGEVYDNSAAAISELLSTAIIPTRRNYAEL